MATWLIKFAFFCRSFPYSFGRPRQRQNRRHASVVDEDVDAAEPFFDLMDHALHGCGDPLIRAARNGATAAGVDGLDDGLGFIAARSACNQRDFSLKPHSHSNAASGDAFLRRWSNPSSGFLRVSFDAVSSCVEKLRF
jgi:hypothetical protein